MIMPPRGPRSVLCVVVGTTSAMRTRVTDARPRRRGRRCARCRRRASRRPRARSRRTRRSRSCAGYAVPPQKISFGRSLRASVAHLDPCRCGACLGRTPYCDALEVLAGDRHAPAVREVAAGRQAEAHDGLAGLEEREVHGEVRRRARVRLHVGVLDAEQRLRALDRELLDLVDVLLALVVALARIALAILVVEDRAGRLEHRARRVVLRRDQPNEVALGASLRDG